MKELYLIRHGKTYGNTLGRYIGTTDEPLCEEGREALQAIFEAGLYPMPDVLYGSPLKRCRETGAILFPGKKMIPVSRLRECDFGEFENKNYKELSGNAAYQAWIDSNGTLPFPGGESREAFEKRCREGFAELLKGLALSPRGFRGSRRHDYEYPGGLCGAERGVLSLAGSERRRLPYALG